MARRQESKLTALQVTRLKEPGAYADGGNLYLQISQSGGKSWLFRYMLNGQVGTMGLGPLDTVTLARVEAREQRKLLLEGKNPLTIKREAKTLTVLEAVGTRQSPSSRPLLSFWPRINSNNSRARFTGSNGIRRSRKPSRSLVSFPCSQSTPRWCCGCCCRISKKLQNRLTLAWTY